MLLVSPVENLFINSFVPLPSGAAPRTNILIDYSSLIKSTMHVYLEPYENLDSISIANS